MVKIFMSVRNRLAMTKKAIEAIERHSELPYHLYVYNNQTSYKVEEHWKYFRKLYEEGRVKQVTFNTDESTFNAFSKASSFSAFGMQHELDPNRDKFDFLLCLDNDILAMPKFDLRLKVAWDYVKKHKLKHIKVISSLPGGIKNRTDIYDIIPGKLRGKVGRLGGSGAWSMRTNFFTDVGFLSIPQLVGIHKQHDQQYWRLMQKASGNKPYIMGLRPKLFLHVGAKAGSVCNRLTRNSHSPEKIKLDRIKFEEQEEKIDSISFDEFYEACVEDQGIVRGW